MEITISENTQESIDRGKDTEERFYNLALSLGINIKKSTAYQDINEHWDYFISTSKGKSRIEVKSAKKLRRGDISIQYQWIWVELAGVKDKGWLLGGKADLIAIEQKDEFCFVRRTDLIKRVIELVDQSEIVNSVNKARYKVYQREGRRDKISLIEFKKITDLIVRRWKKL